MHTDKKKDALHQCLASLYYSIRTGYRSRKIWSDVTQNKILHRVFRFLQILHIIQNIFK